MWNTGVFGSCLSPDEPEVNNPQFRKNARKPSIPPAYGSCVVLAATIRTVHPSTFNVEPGAICSGTVLSGAHNAIKEQAKSIYHCRHDDQHLSSTVILITNIDRRTEPEKIRGS